MWRNIKLISLLALLLLLLVTVSPCCRAEGSYPIYESELTNIKNDLQLIKQEKQSFIADLNNSKLSLRQAEIQRMNIEKRSADLEQKLTNYQNRLVKQETELTELLNMRRELKVQLTELNESFQQYKKEAEAKIRKLVIQRNVVGVIACILGALAL